MPPSWKTVLDDKGVIFVSAAKSGNAENAIGRRMPLALLATHNIVQKFTVDTERVYVSGFSGGSRIALRLALGYPDLFKGAFLNAGSGSDWKRRHPVAAKGFALRLSDVLPIGIRHRRAGF